MSSIRKYSLNCTGISAIQSASSEDSASILNIEDSPISNDSSPSPPTNLSSAVKKCCTVIKFEGSMLTTPEEKDKKPSAITTTVIINNNNEELNISQENPKPQPKPKNCLRRYLGIVLGLCSCIAFSLAVLIIKSLDQYHPFSLGLWRFTGIFVFSFPILIYYKFKSTKSIFGPMWPLADVQKRKTFICNILRGIFGCTATLLQFASLRYLEIADCTVISFSTPVLTTLIAFFLLGEKCGIVPIFTAFLTLGGVVIIARPPFLTGAATYDYDLMIGTALAFGSMACSTAVFVLLRYLRKLNFAIVTTSFGTVGIIQCLILCASVQRLDLPTNAWDWFLGSMVGVLTFFGQLFLTSALKFESAGSISLIRTCDVIFAFIWQLIFLNVIPDEFSLLGALVVVSGVLIVAFRKWLDELPEKNNIRRKLWFLLK